MTEKELKEALRDVPGADETARAAAHAHWARLAKPLGGLGALETLVEEQFAKKDYKNGEYVCTIVFHS